MVNEPMFGWVSARRIKPGMMERFLQEWKSGPEAALVDPGVRLLYFMQDLEDENRMIGIGLFNSREQYERWVDSAAEDDRRFRMNSYVEAVEEERFFEVTQFPSDEPVPGRILGTLYSDPGASAAAP